MSRVPATEPPRGLPRAADVAIALVALILTSPVLLVALIAIALESRGSPIYRQRRVGLRGEPFDLLKLRTMRQGSDPKGVGTAVVSGDPRVTRVGSLLRRLSLDELPNLVNVLRGELAIVGPRPTLEAQVELYTDRQRRRLEVKPGITGWAQVHGRAGIPWERRIELDVEYVERRSPSMDLRILWLTAMQIVTGRGLAAGDAYAGSDPGSPLRRAAEREQAARENGERPPASPGAGGGERDS